MFKKKIGYYILISLMVEQDTSNIWIQVRFLDKNIFRDMLQEVLQFDCRSNNLGFNSSISLFSFERHLL